MKISLFGFLFGTGLFIIEIIITKIYKKINSTSNNKKRHDKRI